jgi:magnesium transporter
VIRSYLYGADGKLQSEPPLETMRAHLRDGKGTLWLDLEDPTPEEVGLLGPMLFGFHPLEIEDCISAQSRPKIDDFEDHLYLVFHAWSRKEGKVSLEEIDFFLGPNYLVTFHQEKRMSVDEVVERGIREPRLTYGSGADMLLHEILDRMVGRYNFVVDDIDERVEDLEARILSGEHVETLKCILELRKELQDIFRTIRHQRDVVNSLAREGHKVVSKKGRQFFRDVYDQVVRVHDTVEGLREQVATARDAHLALAGQRLNEVMKGLSVVATILLPLTFVTGLYGMNFPEMPLLHDANGFWIIVAAMIIVTSALLWVFNRRGWL